MKNILRIAIVILTAGLVACEEPSTPIVPDTTIASLGQPGDNEILFTTIDGRELMALNDDAFNANIISIEYVEYGVNIICFDAPLTTIGAGAFDNCRNINNISLPESVTTIGEHAFYECIQLECISLGAQIKKIGANAFDNCVSLHSLHISSIGYWSQIEFANPTANPINNSGCFIVNGKKVKDLAIPNWVSHISDYAFYNYINMSSVQIPASIKSIGKDAFAYCEGLSKVDVESVAEWCKIDFANTYSNPLSMTGTLTQNGQTLSTLSLEGIETVAPRAFMGCSSITTLVTDKSLHTIGKEAFRGCEKLTSIELGEGVSELGNSAFMGCMTLKSVKCHATVPPTLGDKYVFDYNAEGRKIYVPSEALDTYKSHEQWSRYADSIEALK